MIVMCFEKHPIFGDDPLLPYGKDFGDVIFPPKCNMTVYLSKSHVVVKCGEIDAFFSVCFRVLHLR